MQVKGADELAAEVDAEPLLSASAKLFGVGQVGDERMRFRVDDDVGRLGGVHLGAHPLVLDDLQPLLVPGEPEAILGQRLGHQNRHLVPLQPAPRHIVQLLRRRRQHVLLSCLSNKSRKRTSRLANTSHYKRSYTSGRLLFRRRKKIQWIDRSDIDKGQ